MCCRYAQPTDQAWSPSVVGTAGSVSEARDRAYTAVEQIAWPGVEVRTDIAG